jgi:hypothetical protein
MNMVDMTQKDPEETTTVVIRSFNPEIDSGLIYSTWRRNLWFEEPREESEAHKFFSTATKAIRKILSHPKIKINIACFSDDPDIIVGYSVFTDDNLEWCYVKIDSRHNGIARLLTKGLKTISSPPTKIGKSIASSHDLTIKENENGSRNIDPHQKSKAKA